MQYQNVNNKILTKPKDSEKDHTGPSQINIQGKKMAKIINSEEIDIKVYSDEFRKDLERARNEKGLKQVDFARQLGIKETTLKLYESGKEVPPNNLIAKMEQILGTKLLRPKPVKN